jgi:uncharacterized protein
MPIDIHTHTWNENLHCTESFLEDAFRMRNAPIEMTVDFDAYMKAMDAVEKCVVFGLKGRHTGVYVPNEYVAAFAARAPDKIIGFMAIDPTDADFVDDFEHSHTGLKLKGVKLGPIYANFDPTDRRLDFLYQQCQRRHIPILFHMGTTFCRFAPLKFSRPYLIDEVATRFPDLKIVMAHLGHPWEAEAIVTIRKHPNVYCDISALFYRPWQLYNSLILAQEYAVMPKLLFGSDYPVTTPEESFAGLKGLNRMVEGTNLPRVSETRLDEVIERDSLSLLGL